MARTPTTVELPIYLTVGNGAPVKLGVVQIPLKFNGGLVALETSHTGREVGKLLDEAAQKIREKGVTLAEPEH